MPIAIQTENLGKKYIIRHEGGGRAAYRSLREDVTRSLTRFAGRIAGRGGAAAKKEEFWALRGVSLQVGQGDRVGIIGRNGAGKTTLLKLVSRITEPTEGRIRIKGRVASLLEVGTGFHPELTGRENVFLNGAVLGMGRAEIRKKFDEIVNFAEVEKFLDTPVKRYSSGMYVRLAFAVAAHLEPEILLVDEVLAVGDAAFQKKCLGKMRDVSRREGRTVLFVSHNMNAVEQLCGSCVLVEGGRLAEEGSDVRSVIRRYLYSGGASPGSPEWSDDGERFANPYFTPRRFALTDAGGKTLAMPVRNDGDAYVLIEGDVERPDDSLTIGYAVYNEGGALMYWTYQTDSGESGRPQLRRGRNVIASPLPGRLLNEGVYRLEMIGGLHFRSWLFEPGRAVPEIYLDIKGGLSDSPYWMARRPGAVAPVIRWKEWPVR